MKYSIGKNPNSRNGYKKGHFVSEELKKIGKANIKNHDYTRNIEDYKWLCYKCHKNLDLKTHEEFEEKNKNV